MIKLKKGFGLAEIVISSVILATTFVGLVATFVMVRDIVRNLNVRLNATYVAKEVLDRLYNEVTVASWDNNNDSFFDTDPAQNPHNNPFGYPDTSYTVNPTISSCRQVVVVVDYTNW